MDSLHLFTPNGDFGWSLEPQTNAHSGHFNNLNDDLICDDDALANPSTENQHRLRSLHRKSRAKVQRAVLNGSSREPRRTDCKLCAVRKNAGFSRKSAEL
jgi:hypothetical protein